ncbi:MAG: hypothetical protein A2087_14185 [Spirochaetes bacterium GWD1_61_31]|nr:MAG: hypothetical protein A2Y37_04070 [Spirochaetes bacterium GWB1_60_80]OHD30559.1 MAG: hypothetical protein A2004_05455 [Spirochaetes bacterium GWC1_61_12]OHD34826.1 MAG: hypothetical protein A2087_14185 [Spirochaetes bacterium GWD1_61_31]OHD46672.1 MAG: hypothetical protein A2Y35_11010 [Spirochaetes bacterium GWE1_60_18]OHD61548.1 MAG: hypothetical protein A2Y32_09570 [Spirochaetes bacterium GWF1_60_12]HAP44197.1 hypothetical protein [Spirochaetaceae bacterium]
MVQFYFLSVVFNFTAGYALLVAKREPKGIKLDGLVELIKDPVLRLILGVLCATIGFLKLLTVMRPDYAIIGDFLPSVVGMVAGFTLLLEFYRNNTTVTTDLLEKLDHIFIVNSRWVGIASIVIAVLHFLFPSLILL